MDHRTEHVPDEFDPKPRTTPRQDLVLALQWLDLEETAAHNHLARLRHLREIFNRLLEKTAP